MTFSKKYEPIGVADIVQTVKVMQTLKGIADDDEVTFHFLNLFFFLLVTI